MNGQIGASRWERWTVDEIADGVARVLVARESPARSADALEDLRAPARAAAVAAGPAETHRRAMAAEDRTDAWLDEVGTYLEASRLARFVDRHRHGKPGLPGRRPLREGDVFYVEIPADPSFEGLGDGAAGPDRAAEPLGRYETAEVDVLDLTAAARQSAKVVYQRTVRVGSMPGERRG